MACLYNEGIDCHFVGKCETCGFNPEVSKKRLEKRFPNWMKKQKKKKTT